MNATDVLNQRVTRAIRFAEELEEAESPSTSAAYLLVSHIEEELAKALPYGSDEQRIAWKGAVAAAMTGKDFFRARGIIAECMPLASKRTEFDKKLREELVALIPGHE